MTDRLKPHLPLDLASWLDLYEGDIGVGWSRCPHAHWLIRMATAVGVDRRTVVQAAVDVVRDALTRLPVLSPAGKSALRTAEAWLDGRASASRAWASGFSASDAADQEPDPRARAATTAAAFVAFACDDHADATFYAHRAYAARAVESIAVAIDDERHALGLVRARVSLSMFMQALEIASEPPPPLPELEVEATTDSFYA